MHLNRLFTATLLSWVLLLTASSQTAAAEGNVQDAYDFQAYSRKCVTKSYRCYWHSVLITADSASDWKPNTLNRC